MLTDVETDAQVVRRVLTMPDQPHRAHDDCEAIASLDRILAELQQAEERATKVWWNRREHELEDERDALREAWSDTALALGLPPDYSGDDIVPAVNAVLAELQQVKEERQPVFYLEGVIRGLRTENERYREAFAIDPDDYVVEYETDGFGPSSVTLLLSGSKAEREAQVAALRAALAPTTQEDRHGK